MFTGGVFFAVAAIAWWVSRNNNRDRASYDNQPTNDPGLWLLLLHLRQDIALAVWLLAGILIMLGVIADRIG